MPIETEIKIKIGTIEALKNKIIEMHAELFKKRALEVDEYFDKKDSLKKADQLLRLRDNSILTWKGPGQKAQKMKSREEIEVMVDNGVYIKQILEKLGYTITMRKEKYRESYIFHLTKICIDETPMGNFLEIEGSKEGVLDVVKRLGFTEKNFITKSYNTLWEEHAKKHKIRREMVFPK